MHVIRARNVNEALAQGIDFIRREGVPEQSRNGPVLRVPEPVSTVYERPMERVLFAPWRDANPFFHLMEALWMIAGRDTLAELVLYVKDFGKFSDDGGVTMPAAYGRRWRDWHSTQHQKGFKQKSVVNPDWGQWPDQLDWAVKRLRNDPTDRRVVISMWDANVDPRRADNNSADVPCNLTMLPKIVGGALTLTVFCRSNDMLLGAYGANAVHFSFVQEYLAARIGVPVGPYTQVSVDFHVYTSDLNRFGVTEVTYNSLTDGRMTWEDPYFPGQENQVESFPIFQDFHWEKDDKFGTPLDDIKRDQWIRRDLELFFNEGPQIAVGHTNWPFLLQVAAPMALAHQHWRENTGEERYIGALEILASMPARNDWKRAGEEWIQRRYDKWKEAHAEEWKGEK